MKKEKVLLLLSSIPNQLWEKYHFYVPQGGHYFWADRDFHSCICIDDINAIDVIGEQIKIYCNGGIFGIGPRIQDGYVFIG